MLETGKQNLGRFLESFARTNSLLYLVVGLSDNKTCMDLHSGLLDCIEVGVVISRPRFD